MGFVKSEDGSNDDRNCAESVSECFVKEDGLVGGLVVIAVLLVLSFILEKGHEKIIELSRKKGKKHFLAIIKKVTTELMILGFVSFLFFVLIRSTPFSKLAEKAGVPILSEEFLEFVHMFLFVIVLIYVVIIVYLILLGGFIKRQWKKFEKRSQIGDPHKKSPKFLGFFYTPAKYKYYRKLRQNFLMHNGLGNEFDYYNYLKEVFQIVFSEVVELSWKVWLILMSILGIDYLDHKLFGDISFNFFNLVIWAFSLYLWWRVIQIRNKLAKNPANFHQKKHSSGHRSSELHFHSIFARKHNENTPLLPETSSNNNSPKNSKNINQPLPKEERDELNFNKSHRWRFCLIPCGRTSQYESLFPFGRPHLLVTIAQILVFFQSVYIAVSLMMMWNQVTSFVPITILNVVVPFLNITFIIGSMLPVMCQVLGVDAMYVERHKHHHKKEENKRLVSHSEL